jgi:hypothetical protein
MGREEYKIRVDWQINNVIFWMSKEWATVMYGAVRWLSSVPVEQAMEGCCRRLFDCVVSGQLYTSRDNA